MNGTERIVFDEFIERTEPYGIIHPKTVSIGDSLSIQDAMKAVGFSGHGAIDPVEGCVWRVERNKLIDKHSGDRKWVVDYLVKYVRPDKIDGLYLSKDKEIYNEII